MAFKTGLIIGAAAGYVLGAKAGRERYEQILDAWAKFSGNDRIQELAAKGREAVDLATERVKDAVTERFGDEAGE
jgi:hypothetical protein